MKNASFTPLSPSTLQPTKAHVGTWWTAHGDNDRFDGLIAEDNSITGERDVPHGRQLGSLAMQPKMSTVNDRQAVLERAARWGVISPARRVVRSSSSRPLAPRGDSHATSKAGSSHIASMTASPARLAIVTHHKSGTYAAMSLAALLCFNESDYTIFRRTHEFFFQQWPRVRRVCSNVSFSSGTGLTDKTATHVIHFIRSVPAMVLSGYLYHRRCEEPWLTDKATAWRFQGSGSISSVVNGSYCRWLRNHNHSDGLRMEMARSMTTVPPYSDVGGMLRDIEMLRRQVASGARRRTLSVCTDDLLAKNKTQRRSLLQHISSMVAPFNPRGRAIHFAVVHAHMSSPKQKEQLRADAVHITEQYLADRNWLLRGNLARQRRAQKAWKSFLDLNNFQWRPCENRTSYSMYDAIADVGS
jgi:hypothetical protein